MRKIKLAIWTVVLIILDASVTRYIRIFDAVPMLTYAFVICTAVQEEEFTVAAVIGGVCGILYGSLAGQSFEAVFMFFALSAVLVNYFKGKSSSGLVKAVIRCGVLTAAAELVIGIVQSGIVSALAVLMPAVYNIAAVLIIYPILEYTVYIRKKKSII